MKKEILFIGDSITEGTTGKSFINLLREELENKNYILRNHGLGGDTLMGVKNRLEDLLMRGNKFEIIVIEAGHNDIALPYFAKHDPAWQDGVEMLKEQGIIPLSNSDEFENKLDEILKFLEKNHEGQTIITTLSCLGENLKSVLNKQREGFNEIIRKKASEYNIKLAEVAKAFDEELIDKQDRVVDKDLWKTFLNPPSSSLIGDESKTFFLTIDGVHINKEGAEIYAREIKKCLGLE